MDKIYSHKKIEDRIYSEWEKRGYFKPEINPAGRPYSIILPPPNANGNLHFGHAMFTIEDILIRYHRMKGFAALWLPGTDHAGFETQFVFEKHLANEGKSRFDYDRETLYQMIWDFVQKNREGMESQLRKLGFSLDWSRMKFTLDPDIISIVYKTFKKMYDTGLVYRAKRLVNYCTYDGTSFSDLEVVMKDTAGILYEISYSIKGGGEIIVATSRPETMYGDAAVMVHPEDLRYKNLIDKSVLIPLTDREIPIVADEFVDKEFGTGAVKVTPLHNFDDWEVGQRHELSGIQVIGFDGKMQNTGVVDGLFTKEAREKTIELLEEKGFLRGKKGYDTTRRTCYKCRNVLEPLPLEQWFIKVKPLAEKAIDAVKKGKIKITPRNFESVYYQWLENLRDWNISRQIVWGIRIPAWFCEKCSNWTITEGKTPEKCSKCDSKSLRQDSDTFDTWFSSGQWPFATLLSQSSSNSKFKIQNSKLESSSDFEKFYPTSVMETAYDILKSWVTRMVMFGIYLTGEVPFRQVLFHGIVNDPYGKKMSKSKGNVVNPLELIDRYGADSVRFALIYGNATGNDQSLSYTKLEGARKFTNKLWNIARFINMKQETLNSKSEIRNNLTIEQLKNETINKLDKEWVGKIGELVPEITRYLDSYQFNLAAERLYEFIWHEFADKYIENVKGRIDKDSFLVLSSLFLVQLKLLHPFMPFVTEEINEQLSLEKKMLIISDWPES